MFSNTRKLTFAFIYFFGKVENILGVLNVYINADFLFGGIMLGPFSDEQNVLAIREYQSFRKSQNILLHMFIYTENDTNLIDTLKTSIYNPKHIKNMKIHFNFFKNTYFPQKGKFN